MHTDTQDDVKLLQYMWQYTCMMQNTLFIITIKYKIQYTLMGRNITRDVTNRNCEYHFINGIKTGLVTCSHNLVQHSWLLICWHNLNFTAHGILKNPQDYPILLVTWITLCKLYHGWGSHYHFEALQWRHALLTCCSLFCFVFLADAEFLKPLGKWESFSSALLLMMKRNFYSLSFPCLSTNTNHTCLPLHLLILFLFARLSLIQGIDGPWKCTTAVDHAGNCLKLRIK